MSVSFTYYPLIDSSSVSGFTYNCLLDFNVSEPDRIEYQILEQNSFRILYTLLETIRNNCSNQILYVVVAPLYDDRFYRSSYSLYHCSKHFRNNQRCSRLFLFDSSGIINDCWEPAFIGSIVKKPLQGMEIGRTLIDPQYIHSNYTGCIRTAPYSETMYGKRLHVNAFPYSMQDGETVTCAETTIINIMDYFSQKYQEYRVVYPDEISMITHENSYDRNLPSKGLSYQKISKIFMELGFYPRLYASRFIQERFNSILHTYVESGIPVALGINDFDDSEVGHSIIVVGTLNYAYKEIASGNKTLESLMTEELLGKKSSTFIASINGYSNDYVIMDDNRPAYTVGRIYDTRSWDKHLRVNQHRATLVYSKDPYQIDSPSFKLPFEDALPSELYEKFAISFLTVPLNRDMAMEADEAHRCFRNILRNSSTGYTAYTQKVILQNQEFRDNHPDEYIQLVDKFYAGQDKDNPLLLRIFLCAARNYKHHRISTLGETSPTICEQYMSVHMPRYIWVCELFTKASIMDSTPTCVGEIVLDATTINSHGDDLSNIVLITYPGKLAFRNPEESVEMLIARFESTQNLSDATERNIIEEWNGLVPFEFATPFTTPMV